MSPVDQYIRRATAGLPGRTRVDTAAELRVHLNQRISQFRQEGFEQSEAEHLALQQMGPPEPVNRSFLGHILTPRVGWAVLSVLVLGTGAWLSRSWALAITAWKGAAMSASTQLTERILISTVEPGGKLAIRRDRLASWSKPVWLCLKFAKLMVVGCATIAALDYHELGR